MLQSFIAFDEHDKEFRVALIPTGIELVEELEPNKSLVLYQGIEYLIKAPYNNMVHYANGFIIQN